MKVGDCFLELVEFGDGSGFEMMGNVDVGFDRVVVGMWGGFDE